jgi:transposase
MADTAYDADHLRQAIAAKGALAVIPNNPSRALKRIPPAAAALCSLGGGVRIWP